MVDRDLGGAVIGPTSTSPETQEAARRYLTRNGHTDLLEILGLAIGSHLCPYCQKRPWVGSGGGTVCRRKTCQQARASTESTSD